MNKIMILATVCALGLGALSACQPAQPAAAATEEEPPTATPTALPVWQVVAESTISHKATVVGFNDASFGITAGYAGELHYSRDGGASWPRAVNNSYCRFGLEIVDDQVAWHCGNAGHVRRTLDGGKTWRPVTGFGPGEPAHCRFLSFVSDTTGWAATRVLLGTTTDGAQTWNERALPEGIGNIAAIAVYAPGQGYLLDASGALFASTDDGVTWAALPAVDLGGLSIRESTSPTVALRFFDAQNGLLVVSAIKDSAGVMAAFRTADGGQTWTSEVLPVPFGTPFLSRDGRTLTIYLAPSKITVIHYNGD
jgi:photosystem II stability/assembly factor-like uncharacterized protein